MDLYSFLFGETSLINAKERGGGESVSLVTFA